MHFLQEMEEKQERQCQETWQLNSHWGYVFSSCWPTIQTLVSTVWLIKQMNYFQISLQQQIKRHIQGRPKGR